MEALSESASSSARTNILQRLSSNGRPTATSDGVWSFGPTSDAGQRSKEKLGEGRASNTTSILPLPASLYTGWCSVTVIASLALKPSPYILDQGTGIDTVRGFGDLMTRISPGAGGKGESLGNTSLPKAFLSVITLGFALA